MRAQIEYLKYVLRHKWFVFLACVKLGVPWRGIVHDLSKFSRAEWTPYVRSFFEPDGSRRPEIRDGSGAHDPMRVSEEFRRAWLHHQRNKHHRQAWIVIGDYGLLAAVPMPEVYVREMVADWIGARKAQGVGIAPREYYEANGDRLILHEESRKILLEVLDDHGIDAEIDQADRR